MAKKVLVTGATGTIGTIVREDLSARYDLTLVSRRPIPSPNYRKVDVCRDYDGLKQVMTGQDAVLHLAYVEEDEATVANHLMAKNVYRAALETEPRPRLIMASSIHVVGGHLNWDEEPYCFIARREYGRIQDLSAAMLTDEHRLLPNGLYGALKAYLEPLGEFYASRGLPVVVVRFGGVRCDDELQDEAGYQAFWLSRRDCGRIIVRAIESELARNFVRVFAISDNQYRVHSLANARNLLGYEPQDDAERRSPTQG